MGDFFTKLKSLCVKLWRAYKAWLHKKKVNKHAGLIKKRARLQYKLKSWDDKFAAYFKKVENKKQRLQDKLHRVDKKLGKLDKVFEKEYRVEREIEQSVSVIEPSGNKDVVPSNLSLESKK